MEPQNADIFVSCRPFHLPEIMLTLTHTFIGHRNPVYALALSEKPGIFFSAGNDKGVVEWSLKKMAFLMIKWPIQSSAYALENFDNQLICGERSGRITIFDFLSQRLTADFVAHPLPVFSLKVIRHKRELVSVSEDGSMAVWSMDNYKELFRQTISTATARTIAISPDEKEIAVGCKDGIIYLFNSEDYSLKRKLSGHTGAITALSYSADGSELLSGSRDAHLKVWDETGLEKNNITAHMFAIYGIAVHPFEPLFATCSQDKSIKIWDSTNFRLLKILSIDKTGSGHTHSVNVVHWTADGKHLLSAGDDRTVLLWTLI